LIHVETVDVFTVKIFCYLRLFYYSRHTYVVVFFVFGDLRWDVIVCFVDIGGIVDHHCLNCLFITNVNNMETDYLLKDQINKLLFKCWYSKQWQNTNLPTVYKENLLFQIHLCKVLPQLKTDYVVISCFSSVEMC
jgi:hypothetical protein